MRAVEDPEAYVVIPRSAYDAVTAFLMELPWRTVNHLLVPLDGVATLDEYVRFTPERSA